MKRKISTDKAPAAIGPYSQGIVAGNTLYASGQIRSEERRVGKECRL